jgi:hypothetical protein
MRKTDRHRDRDVLEGKNVHWNVRMTVNLITVYVFRTCKTQSLESSLGVKIKNSDNGLLVERPPLH